MTHFKEGNKFNMKPPIPFTLFINLLITWLCQNKDQYPFL